MRKLLLLTCAALAAAFLVAGADASGSDSGNLSVDKGKGWVTLDLRGSILGRLGSGSLTVTDRTPRDPYTAMVFGRKLTQTRLGPRTVRYRGQGLRFRMLGGTWHIVVHGTGMSLSAVGWGVVQLQAERKLPTDDAGVYSVDGTDCSVDPTSCMPLPDDPLRLTLGTLPATSSYSMGNGR